MADPGRFLSTIQIGVTLAGYLASTITAVTIGEQAAIALLKLMPGLLPYKETIMVLTSTILISYLTLVGGELVPKRLALQNPAVWARRVARPLLLFSKLFAPFIWFLNKSSTLILKGLGLELKTVARSVSEDELKLILPGTNPPWKRKKGDDPRRFPIWGTGSPDHHDAANGD